MNTYEPTQEDVQNQGRTPSWRIADGVIAKGRADDGNLETRTHMTGKPIRFGLVPEYTLPDGKPVPPKFRVELVDIDGQKETLQCRLDSTQARGLMSALTIWEGGYITISPNKSAKANKYGKFVTYCNVKEITGPGKTCELRVDCPDGEWESWPETLASELEGRHEYKDYIRAEGDEDSSPWAALNAFLEGAGFQPYAKQPEYDQLLQKAAKKPVTEFSDAEWAKAPAWMDVAVEKGLLPDTLAEYDPFADE